MKKILALVFLGLLANCSHDLTSLRAPKIKDQINNSATLYIDPAMKKNYIFSSNAMAVGADIFDGVKKDNGAWGQNIGELSAQQFQDALEKAFTKLSVSSYKSSNNSSYLVVPTIVKANVTLRDFWQSSIELIYKIEVYNKSGKLVYSDEVKTKKNGKLKSSSVTFVGGIPIMGQATLRVDDSSMIFEAISEGVDEIVNKLLKSGKL
jgi:hypothetical protein